MPSIKKIANYFK
jgi:hypothetical protein